MSVESSVNLCTKCEFSSFYRLISRVQLFTIKEYGFGHDGRENHELQNYTQRCEKDKARA